MSRPVSRDRPEGLGNVQGADMGEILREAVNPGSPHPARRDLPRDRSQAGSCLIRGTRRPQLDVLRSRRIRWHSPRSTPPPNPSAPISLPTPATRRPGGTPNRPPTALRPDRGPRLGRRATRHRRATRPGSPRPGTRPSIRHSRSAAPSPGPHPLRTPRGSPLRRRCQAYRASRPRFRSSVMVRRHRRATVRCWSSRSPRRCSSSCRPR